MTSPHLQRIPTTLAKMPLKTSTLLFSVLLACLGLAAASPVPRDSDGVVHKKILYDQRQEGEWNVRADLNNIVISIIPISKGISPFLLDLLRTVPKGYMKQVKRLHHASQESGKAHGADLETQHFIETKTAPYHVDIGESRSQLAKLHPDSESADGEVVIASSPHLSLVSRSRSAKMFDPAEGGEFLALIKVEGSKKSAKGEARKKTIKEAAKGGKGKLLGGEGEVECAPGQVRDSYGACRTVQK